jgi:hypothetical protein
MDICTLVRRSQMFNIASISVAAQRCVAVLLSVWLPAGWASSAGWPATIVPGIQFQSTFRVIAATLAIAAPVAAGSAQGYWERGDWYLSSAAGQGVQCVLGTGGYDRERKAPEPMLSVTVNAEAGGGAEIELTATAESALTMAEIRRMHFQIRVDGSHPVRVPALPSAIVETAAARTITLRPLFDRADKQRRLLDLIAALRSGERVVVDINGRPLEPTFSLRGFAEVWEKAKQWCAFRER